jgi:hypothetical protein
MMIRMNPNPDSPREDPLIDEVRAIRKRISDKFGNDVDRLIDHLRQVEKQQPARIVKPAAERRV